MPTGLIDSMSMTKLSLRRIALNALGLLVLIPFLGIVYLFWDEVKGKWVPLLFLLFIAILGYALVWTLVATLTRVMKGLEKVSRGEATSIEVDSGPDPLREMAEIINALNKLTNDFHENARQLQTFIQQFATLTELTEITAKIPDIHELLGLVLRRAMANTYARKGTVMLIREGEESFEIIASEGWKAEDIAPIEIKGSLAFSVIETGEPLLVTDLNLHPELGHSHDSSRYQSSSFLIMPLKTKSTVIGAVCLSERGGNLPFTHQDQQFLTVVLGQIGYAVENARLLKQARDSADALKEVVNCQEVKIKDAWEQILRSEKLSALGQLIAGVAHELNNPLTSILGYTGLAIEALGDGDSRVVNRLDTVMKEASRATRIVQNLLSFARTRKSERQMAQINDIIENIISLRRYDLRSNRIDLVTELDPELPKTLLDSDQIQQVLLNLVNNSAQAMGSDGLRQITLGSHFDEDSVYFFVRDTGCGIPESVASRIFEPFFTTKEGDSGNGLGLSISSGIIKEHGGEMLLESQEGIGTTMTVRLPRTNRPEVLSAERKEVIPAPQAVSDQRILVVDDEEPIALLVAEYLDSMGSEVHVCTSGKQALERIDSEAFTLILSDVRMPDVDGFTVFKEVEKHRPELVRRFALMTGDVTNKEIRKFAEDHGLPILHKPFTKQEVLETLSQFALT
ncbi:MAG: Sensor histidine kinase RcsC [bacterium]|nr:MAG: Blue-light-activated protein [Candidatus Hinthialibacteria bacterium OLB16]MBV6480830.1 Sensor histidine kinase RcsC [bacterium]MCE7907263.1 response regulator [Candidatus Omnitrophica bacterium COP1]